MLNVVDNKLVVEEKGIYTIEKFLHSRRIMYWQVYLHKTVLAAEKMLVNWLDEIKIEKNTKSVFPKYYKLKACNTQNLKKMLGIFADIDDTDITFVMKKNLHSSNPNLKNLSYRLLNRKLFKCEISSFPFSKAYIDSKKIYGSNVFVGKETTEGYKTSLNEIIILYKNGKLAPLSTSTEFKFNRIFRNRSIF